MSIVEGADLHPGLSMPETRMIRKTCGGDL